MKYYFLRRMKEKIQSQNTEIEKERKAEVEIRNRDIAEKGRLAVKEEIIKRRKRIRKIIIIIMINLKL